MNEQPTFVSLFAGIEGIGLGLERAGWRCIAQVEIDKFCRRVLDRRSPDVPKFGDVRDFGAASFSGTVDLICGGFPCQDVSVAGRRAGLAGPRSGLFFEFVRVARELQPRWLLLENVPGLLSSNAGRDFALVLAELGRAGYFVEWRVLDSRWFGVPQRRRRVFLVGHLGGPPARSILFEREGSGGNLAPISAPREELAGTFGLGTPGARGFRTTDLDNVGAFVVSPAVTSKWRKGAGGPAGDETQNLVIAPPLVRGVRHQPGSSPDDATALVISTHGNDAAIGEDVSTPLKTDGDAGSGPVVFALMPTSEGKYFTGRETDVAQPLTTAAGQATGNQGGDVIVAPLDLRNATRSSGKSGAGTPSTGVGEDGDPAFTTSAMAPAVIASSVRRLTPTECERLQGFPDGWTCLCGVTPYSTSSCRCPDGPRYAAIGNAVTVNVAEWIGGGIAQVGE